MKKTGSSTVKSLLKKKETSDIVEYLSRYTHKTAIYNQRLVVLNGSSVSFKYRDYRDNQVKVMTLEAEEFIRRFLMHVLPTGFQKVRYYGLLSNRMRNENLKKCFRLLKMPLTPKKKYSPKELMLKVLGVDISICPHCGGRWITIRSILPKSEYNLWNLMCFFQSPFLGRGKLCDFVSITS